MNGIDIIMKAAALAGKAHAGQFDKSGVDYINHPLTVAADVASKGYDYRVIVAALLHDVAEDCEYTLDDISGMFPDDSEIIAALTLLTHDDEVPYMEYVEAVKSNEIARAVKMADLRHNMDLSRFGDKQLTDRDVKRLEKYKAAYSLLEK